MMGHNSAHIQHQLQDLGDDVNQKDLLSAATAFFKWRQAALKANFRKELEGILEEVAQEEEASSKVQKQLQKTQERLDETVLALSKVTDEHRLALAHMDQLRAQNDEFFRALQAAEGASRVHAEQARTATILHQEEVKRRQDDSRKAGLEIDALREQYRAMVTQQQTLLDNLAQRDREVAEAKQEALHHKRNAARLQEEVERLEAITRATGERAAAAEAQAAARSDSLNKLYAELSGLRERYHNELSELKAARVGAAEAQRMRERLDSMQASNDSLVAARDELRASLESVMAKLTAAEQRLKRQAVAATMRESLIDTIANVSRELLRDGEESLVLQATTRLSSELDLALTANTDLSERLTSAEAVIAQQQGHIRRLVEECSSLVSQLRESRDSREAVQRLNCELGAELQRMAAEAALGPVMVLDVQGQLVVQQPPQPTPAAATAPATSQLEAQATAVRVILAEKAFGLGALCAAIASHPGSIQSVRAQLSECRALSKSLRVEVEEVGALLGVRPFEAQELARKIPVLQDRLAKTETCLVAVREDLTLKQVHAVSLEARVLAAESAMRAGASLLQGWSGLLSQAVAVEDGRLEPDVRLGLREELKTREDALHRAMLDLAAAAPPLLGGDPGYAAAQVAMREGCNAMMELALTLGDRLVEAPATRTRVLAAERLLADRAAALTRFREVLAGAPGEVADAVERLTAVIPDVQAMGPAVEEMLRCVQHYLTADREQLVDVVALQGEVLTLRGLVRTKDMHIQALEAVGTGIRTGSPTKRAQKMVPLEALHAAESSRDTMAGEKAALQSRLVDQRVLLVAARHRLVNYMAGLREACEKAEVLYKWRTAAAVIKANRAHADMDAAQKEQARVEQQAREDRARLEAEMASLHAQHAAETAALVASHAAAVEALNSAHEAQLTAAAEEQRRSRMLALQAAETRVAVLRRVMKEKAARFKDCLTHATLYLWRFRVHRQVQARQRWRHFADALRYLEEPQNPTYRDVMTGPRMTVARRLVLHRTDPPPDLVAPAAVTGRQIARMIMQAWRGWVAVKLKHQRVDALTESVPTFIENLGDRRRLERAWLGLRLWTAGSVTQRAHHAIRDYEAAAAGAAAARAVAEAAAAASAAEAGMVVGMLQGATQTDEDWHQQQQQRHTSRTVWADGAPQGGQLVPLSQGYDSGQLYRPYSSGSLSTQHPDQSLMLYQLPRAEVGTQYLPNAHAVLSTGSPAPPHHVRAAGTVATAQAAGLEVEMQPLTASVGSQQPQVAAPGGFSNPWGELRGPGSMPPVAGPSQAAVAAALSRRRPGAPVTAQGPDPARARVRSTSGGSGRNANAGGGGGGGSAPGLKLNSRPSAPAGGTATAAGMPQRSASTGRLTGARRSMAQHLQQGNRQQGASRAGGGPVLSAVASLQERAQRLVRAVDAISAGVADSAALLSPRRKVLQVNGPAATDLDESLNRELAALAVPDEAPFLERPAAVSPTRRLQPDGTRSMEYHTQVPPDARATAPDNSPPRSPTTVFQSQRGALERAEGSDPALRPALSAPEPLAETNNAAADAQGTAQAAGVAPRAAGRGVAEGRHAGGAAGGGGGPQPLTNSVQMLLNRAHGRNKPQREDSRTYDHVGSRLHDETVSTLAKKRKSFRAAVDTLPPAMLVETSLQAAGVAAARPMSGAIATFSAWPRMPPSELGPSGAAIGPNAAERLRCRGADVENYPPPIEISIPPPSQQSAQTPGPAAPTAAAASLPLPVSVAPVAAKMGRVVRFERVTPSGVPPTIEVNAEGPAGSDGGETIQDEGLVTYIQLPSPVKVSIKLPGT